MCLMKRSTRFRPTLEALENRTCPAGLLKVTYSLGTLTLNGSPTAGPAIGQNLTIRRVSGTNYQVLDNAATPINYGTYYITRDLRLNLTQFNTDINVDLNGGLFPGNI